MHVACEYCIMYMYILYNMNVASTVNVLSLNYVQHLRMYVYYTVYVMHTGIYLLYVNSVH